MGFNSIAGWCSHVYGYMVVNGNYNIKYIQCYFIDKYDIPRYYDSYEQLAKDDAIDIIYVGAIQPMHYNNVILCLENGKHVLCEKPMGITYTQVKTMINCARRNYNIIIATLQYSLFIILDICGSVLVAQYPLTIIVERDGITVLKWNLVTALGLNMSIACPFIFKYF